MIRNKMLGFLAVREHSAMELRRKLKQRFYKSASGEISVLVERCLLELQESDFQSDERFTRCFVESKLTNKPQGPFKILQDLQNRGISNELAQTVLNELSDQDIWLKKAVECLVRIQKNTKIHTQAALSQKLYQRGFAWETIEQALEEYQNFAEHADTGEFNSVPVVLTTKNP
jgi:regulatory protein